MALRWLWVALPDFSRKCLQGLDARGGRHVGRRERGHKLAVTAIIRTVQTSNAWRPGATCRACKFCACPANLVISPCAGHTAVDSTMYSTSSMLPAILVMDQIGTPREGTRPTRGRFRGVDRKSTRLNSSHLG